MLSNADAMFRELKYKKMEAPNYIEYYKQEEDGLMSISIMMKPTISVYIRKYIGKKQDTSIPEAIYEPELNAINEKIKELKEE